MPRVGYTRWRRPCPLLAAALALLAAWDADAMPADGVDAIEALRREVEKVEEGK